VRVRVHAFRQCAADRSDLWSAHTPSPVSACTHADCEHKSPHQHVITLSLVRLLSGRGFGAAVRRLRRGMAMLNKGRSVARRRLPAVSTRSRAPTPQPHTHGPALGGAGNLSRHGRVVVCARCKAALGPLGPHLIGAMAHVACRSRRTAGGCCTTAAPVRCCSRITVPELASRRRVTCGMPQG
jgi:hypothetical protein